MKVTLLNIPDILLIEPEIFDDERGFFFESFNADQFRKVGLSNLSFVQDNHLKSLFGVLRGLHYQLPPYAQGKLIRVIQGVIFDVAVDLRRSSSTFGKYTSKILSAENKKQIWIPPGFAHGFLTMSESSEVLYKTSNFYNPEFERNIVWNDSELNINWPKNIDIKVSLKDSLAKTLDNAALFD